MIHIKNSEKNAIFLFIWLHSRVVPNISEMFIVEVESRDYLKISEESAKSLSDGCVYSTLLEILSKGQCLCQGLEQVLQKLRTLSGAPIYTAEFASRNVGKTDGSPHYYSLERKNAERGLDCYHCVTSEDLSYPVDERSRETWVRAHCAVIEVLLYLWLRFQVQKKCLSRCLSKMVGQEISLDSSDDLRGADGALFWLVTTAARSATLLGVKDCEKWLEVHMAENTGYADMDQQNDEGENNKVKKTDRFLRGVAIPNLVALLLCHYLPDYCHRAEFRMNFGKKGELPSADTEHNIDRILEISTPHLPPSIMDILPAPRTAKGGLPCEDFACGLARASPQRRLQAAALAGDLFYWTEVSKTPQSQNGKVASVACAGSQLVSGRHTYRLSKGVDKLLQVTRTRSLDDGTEANSQSHARSTSGHMSDCRRTAHAPSGNHALDVLFQRKQNGGPQICSPIFVGAATKLPPVPLSKPVLYESSSVRGRQLIPLQTIPTPPRSSSRRQVLSSRPLAEQTPPLPSSARRGLSEVPNRTRHVTHIPRPSSQHRYSRRTMGAPLHPMDLNRPMDVENFEHYQMSLERLSADLKKVQMELKTMAQHEKEPLPSAVPAAVSQLMTSTTFLPVEDSQQVDVSLNIQQQQSAQMVARRFSADFSDDTKRPEEPTSRHQQEPSRLANPMRTWDRHTTPTGPAPLLYSRGDQLCLACNGQLLSSACPHHRTSLSSPPNLPALQIPGQSVCHTGRTRRSVRRSERLRRLSVRRNRRIGLRFVETVSSTEPESAGEDRSSTDSGGLFSETDDMVVESPSHFANARHQRSEEDKRLLVGSHTPKFEQTIFFQPPPLSSAAEVITRTSAEMGSKLKPNPVEEIGGETIVKAAPAYAREEQSKQRSSEVFIIDLNTIDRIGDLGATAGELLQNDADNHLTARKARILERCRLREEQRVQRRQALAAKVTGTARDEENNSPGRTSPEEDRRTATKKGQQRRANMFKVYIHKKATSAADVCSPTVPVTRRISPVLSTVSDQASAKEQSLVVKGSAQSFRRAASCINAPLSDQPRLYVQPQHKSNRRVITNALIHCCLAGRVNEQLKVNILQELGRTDGQHFIILLKGGCQFCGLFRFEPESEEMVRVGGAGPHRITSNMIERFYKYDSGSKAFSVIETTSHLSTVVDAVTLLRQTQAKLLRTQQQQRSRPQHQQPLPSQLSNETALS